MFTIRNYFIVVLFILFPAVSFAGQPQCCNCTQQTVVGTYAVASEGTTMMTLPGMTEKMPVPVVSLAILTIDHNGAVSAAGYMAVGGEAQWASQMPGMVTVNPDCTGEIAWKNGEGETIMIGELVIGKGGGKISSIMTQGGPLGEPTVTGRWKRISRIPNLQYLNICRPGCVFGTYVTGQSGVNMTETAGAVPTALLGRLSIHRDGSIEMTGTIVVAGNPTPFTLEDAVLEKGEVACTVRITGSVIAEGTVYMGDIEGWYVVLDHGNELWGIGIELSGGYPVALGTMNRISLWPKDFEQ